MSRIAGSRGGAGFSVGFQTGSSTSTIEDKAGVHIAPQIRAHLCLSVVEKTNTAPP